MTTIRDLIEKYGFTLDAELSIQLPLQLGPLEVEAAVPDNRPGTEARRIERVMLCPGRPIQDFLGKARA